MYACVCMCVHCTVLVCAALRVEVFLLLWKMCVYLYILYNAFLAGHMTAHIPYT